MSAREHLMSPQWHMFHLAPSSFVMLRGLAKAIVELFMLSFFE